MRASRVLLVDHDVDALATLAAELRERGIKVSLANGAQMACERTKAGGFDVVLTAHEVAEPKDGAMGLMDVLSVELTEVPPFLVLVDEGANGESRLAKADIDGIVTRIEALVKLVPERPRGASLIPSAHVLDESRLGDLLVVLSTEKRSGTLTVTTARGYGEVRLVEGDVVDAVYLRLEGKKAMARMVSERDGTATFAPGAPAIMRRIHEPTRTLVQEARLAAARASELRGRVIDLSRGTLVALDSNAGDGSEVSEHVLSRLRVPATLDDLLDELPHPDAAILEAMLALDARGKIKPLGQVSSRVQLCGPDQLHLVRASAARARKPVYGRAARLVFAATPSRIAVFAHTVLSLAEAFPSSEPTPEVPVPYLLSTIRLGDGVELDVVALPLVPAYAPLWQLSLAGAAVVVRLDEAASDTLRDACRSVEVPILDARAVFGTLDEASPVQVASLIKTALDAEGTSASESGNGRPRSA